MLLDELKNLCTSYCKKILKVWKLEPITPVLLAGGSGTRLWPLSRKSYPKQFSKLIGDLTIFQQSALRLTSSSILEFMPPIVMTNTDFRFIVGEQLKEAGVNLGPIIIEPEVKNTAPAILSACLFAFSKNKDSILLVAPLIITFQTCPLFKLVKKGTNHVFQGKMVTWYSTIVR